MSGEVDIRLKTENVSEDDIRQINAGRAWLANWLDKRRDKSGNGDAVDAALTKLNDVQVYLCDDVRQAQLNALENKELMVSEYAVRKRCEEDGLNFDELTSENKEKYENLTKIRAFSAAYVRNEDGTIALTNAKTYEKPVVFVNMQAVRNEQEKNPENKALESIMVHELTHVAKLENCENKVDLQKYTDEEIFKSAETKRNNYADKGNEVYARLMEFRHDNNLDPEKEYSAEELKKIASLAAEKDHSYFTSRYKTETVVKMHQETADVKNQMKTDAMRAFDYIHEIDGFAAARTNNTDVNAHNLTYIAFARRDGGRG